MGREEEKGFGPREWKRIFYWIFRWNQKEFERELKRDLGQISRGVRIVQVEKENDFSFMNYDSGDWK